MDLDSLFNRAFDGFGETAETSKFPGVPGSVDDTGNTQDVDINENSRCFRFSRSESGDVGSDDNSGSEKPEFLAGVDCAREFPFKSPGIPGIPGNDGKSPAQSTLPQFPVKDKEPGTPGTENVACDRPTIDLNRVAPQRPDWWTGPAMAEADWLAPTPGDRLPISAADVRAGVARELRALAEDGREGPGALRDAVEITRAKIRNSEALAERQAHGGRCHACDGPLDDILPMVAVLTARRGGHLFMHAGCYAAFGAQRIALVDNIMTAAGYGAETEGHSRCKSL